MATSIDSVFGGKYEVFRELGRGGMSVVYLAMDRNLNKQWAIKEIRKRARDRNGDIYVQSLMTEANLMKRLDHPAIPRIVDIVENSEAIYVVMDYVEGESLDKVLEKFGPQPQDVVLDWAKQLADALDYLHRQNPPIIYRDMKPANVMLKPEGTVKLIDFGTAREFKGTKLADTVVLGTRGYAAPEQYGKRETDARTDIYCLGMTMHNLLTGQNPCDEYYEYHPVRYWNPQIHEGIERVIEKCVMPDPNNRYQSCTELLYALDNYEYDTEEYRKQQKKKVKQFFVTLGIGALMLVISLGSFITYKVTLKNDYEELVNLPASTDFELKLDSYERAIDINSTKLDAYEKMIEAFEDNGQFGKAEGSELISYFNKYSGDMDTQEYVEMCYKIGFLFFNFYTESGSADDYQAKMNKSAGYFEEAYNVLEANPDISFAKRDALESYYTVTSFYKENSGLQLSKDHTADELRELLDAFGTCIDNLENFDETTDEYAQSIKLSQYKGIASQINKLSAEFAASGVSEQEVLSLMEKIEACVNRISTNSLQDDKEDLLGVIANYKESISRAYVE